MTKTLIIAEAGVNHNGSVDTARRLIVAAKEAGADAIKFQTFSPDRMVSKSAVKADYQKRVGDPQESQYAMLKKLSLTLEQHRLLLGFSRETGIEFFSSAFDEPSADLLSELGVPRFKISSGEITNLSLLDYIARKGKPAILSTGMSSLGEVEQAVATIKNAGCKDLTLLHCTSNYPAEPQNCNLRAILTLKSAFNLPVGYSDHTVGIEIPVAAVALGAVAIEKHLTLDKSLAGPDHLASADPGEFKALVQAIRNVESALGDGVKRIFPSEVHIRDVARKSLVVAADIPEGTVLNGKHIAIKRPGTGISPDLFSMLIGRRIKRNLKADDLFSLEDFE